MLDQGIGYLFISPSSDMHYLTGYAGRPSERLTVFVLPDEGIPSLIIPSLDASNASYISEICKIIPWKDPHEPIDWLVSTTPADAVIGISDQMWATFLLRLQAAMPQGKFMSASPITRKLRIRKSPPEIARLRRACQASDTVFQKIVSTPMAGLSEEEVAVIIAAEMLREGYDRVDFNIVASGENCAAPHHDPTTRKLAPGDSLLLDFGGPLQGYFSDMSRTMAVGMLTPELSEVYRVVQDAQEAAFQIARPGTTCEEVDRAARETIKRAGYGEYFVHRTGHGVGLDVHEDPTLGTGNTAPLEEGMVVTIEPGIYLPGRLGVRIEDVVLVTREGVERLTVSSRELIVVQ